MNRNAGPGPRRSGRGAEPLASPLISPLRFLEYLKLIRFYQAFLVGTMPVLGAMAAGVHSASTLGLLFLTGILFHFSSATMNDIMDVEEDKRSGVLSSHPLAMGTIPMRHAYFIAMFFLLTSALVVVLVSGGSPLAVIFFFLATGFVAVYNILGKKIPGSEFLLSLGYLSLTLFGAGEGGFERFPLVVVVSVAMACHTLLFLTVFSGVWETGFERTTERVVLAELFGARRRGNRFYSSTVFFVYSFSLETILFLSLFMPFVFSLVEYHRFQAVSVFLLFTGTLIYSYRMLSSRIYDDCTIARASVVYYISVGLCFPIVFIEDNPLSIPLLFVPFIELWLSRLILSTHALAPPISTKYTLKHARALPGNTPMLRKQDGGWGSGDVEQKNTQMTAHRRR